MSAGREMDAEVAEKVMGWPERFAKQGSRGSYGGGSYEEVPRYSTDIAAAWQVAEKLGLWVFPGDGVWAAGRPRSLSGKDYVPDMYVDDEGGVVDGHLDMALGATAPHAICLAALKAVGVSPTPSPRTATGDAR